MSTASLPSPAPRQRAGAPVQRQIALPLNKAVEIAYKNIRMRLSRSLLVTSGIVLALAFLMSILVSDAMTGGMRQWTNDTTARLTADREAQQARVAAAEAKLKTSVADASRGNQSGAAAAPPFNVRQ